MSQDCEQSLEWLEKATRLGSGKALSAAANILASLGRPVPENLTTAIREELHSYAKDELHISLSDNILNMQRISEDFASLRLWSRQDSTGYKQYLQSPFLSEMKTATFSAWLVVEGPKDAYEPFDFQLLEGVDLRGDPHFDISKKDQFVNSVLWHKCTESIGHSRLNLLQIAALWGDVKMAEALVVDLGADVNSVGDTPGYTPLWISCLNGHLDTALFLAKHEADARVKDTKDGRTILHFLNRFQSRNDVSQILRIGLQAGLAVDELDLERNTPLLSTFIGWDFSHGAAAQVLLQARADPLVHSERNFSAVVGALRILDVDLLISLFKHGGKCRLKDNENKELPTNPLEQEKALSFNFLCSQNEFYCRRICGPDAAARLKAVVDLILQDNMSSTFRSMGLIEGDTTPLIISCYRRRSDLLEAVLSSASCPDLDEADSYGMTALHWCAERGNLDGIKQLLRAGANPLLFSNKGLNIFHIAARFAPDFLLQTLNAIETEEVPCPQGLDGRALLAIPTRDKDETTPFVLAVMEGTPEHLNCAEALRTRYSLDYDAYEIPALNISGRIEDEAKMTLMAYLTAGSVMTNIITLSQVEYVLNLNPKPRFRADMSGKTLLHFAVCGFYHGKYGALSELIHLIL
jgi:ankyrin repeat protein